VPETEQGDFSVLEKFADDAGYPLLIKAALGGGGKGMRLIHKKEELRSSALRARSEAVNSFGDGALICEQYLTSPRHVEVQILADKHGQAFAIGDRDCSVQRRHQKIIEEAPAIGLTPETRTALHEAAVNLAKAVGYDSTGTVEFLVDWAEPSKSAKMQRFYFLEMNTRLQVEHPVTEEVFGLDLVEWQFRVASGEKLPAELERLEPRGHSVEVRIYAEDVNQNFFPAPGPVAAFRQAVGPGIRWEVGLDELDEVTGRFDPMIAKLIATGATRRIALDRLAEGLERTFFAGPACNMEFLSLISKRSVFAEEAVTTHFLNEHMDALLKALASERAKRQPIADELLQSLADGRFGNLQAAPAGADAAALTQAIFSSKSNGIGEENRAATGLQSLSETVAFARKGQMRAVSGLGQLRRPGAPASRFWYASLKTKDGRQFWVSLDGHHFTREESRAASHQATGAEGVSSEIAAPVPGKVIAVKAEVGKDLALGDTVLVLESMKMEFEVKAARAGKLKSLTVKTGEQVSAGQILASWE
jgi:acetyl/propionyl-CoA carboxylase alpha subunit